MLSYNLSQKIAKSTIAYTYLSVPYVLRGRYDVVIIPVHDYALSSYLVSLLMMNVQIHTCCWQTWHKLLLLCNAGIVNKLKVLRLLTAR